MSELELLKDIAQNSSALILLVIITWQLGAWLRTEITETRKFYQDMITKLIDDRR